ncbi:MAG: formylglycine-generating enzyme family protein [Gaiellales bacterium]
MGGPATSDPLRATPPPGDRLDEMCWIPGGRFWMGSQGFYVEEGPVREATCAGFWIDVHPVTTSAFRRFVESTGHVTVAERAPEPETVPGADPDALVPGSLVFSSPQGPVPLDDPRRWWRYVPGAYWARPEGPDGPRARDDHPVTHVTYADACAYAAWAGKALPTEVEWECAARGDLDGAVFAWGDEHEPDGRPVANTWQGAFPWQDLALDGYAGTSPVASFPPNGFGLYDVCGNVWEWTADPWHDSESTHAGAPCCTLGAATAAPGQRVIKGGSYLCAPSYCFRYRPAARQPNDVWTSTCHLGFRCVRHEPH